MYFKEGLRRGFDSVGLTRISRRGRFAACVLLLSSLFVVSPIIPVDLRFDVPILSQVLPQVEPVKANATCAQGGVCVVGDRGPGGGLVFLIQDGTVYEMSKWARNGNTLTSDFVSTKWCGNSTAHIATGTAIGTGAANTAAMLAACAEGPAQAVDVLVSGGQSDWYLPSKDELSSLVYFLQSISEPIGENSTQDGLTINSYWSSSQGSTTTNAWRNNRADGPGGQQAKSGYLKARAIRSFPNPRAAQVVTWAPETSLSLASSSASLS